MEMREMVAELERRRAEALKLGGPDRIAAQKARGKMTVRERLDALFDPGSFLEYGLHASPYYDPEPGDPPAPGDGCLTGFGLIDGRPAAVCAYDFTVFGGSIGFIGEVKATRFRELALKWRIPAIWLIDSGGARLKGAAKDPSEVSKFAGSGYLFREQVVMSGVVPQVAAMVGPGAAGTAYIPGLADYVPMVKGTSSMALGGPPLVKSVIGEDISEEDLGGSKVHTTQSGCADGEFKSDAECLAAVRDYLSYFPAHCGDKPPVIACGDPVDRRDEALLDAVPENPRKAYDMRDIVTRIVDHGRVFEIKPRFARNLLTCLARFGGQPVGIVANNPKHLGGILDIDAADKAARFINLCDAFQIPLLFLQDVPGFMVGSKVEQAGIIRHGAKMLYATSMATVPKITIVVRKAYGAGYYVMNGRAYEPDYIASWPGGEIAVMGAEGMIAIAMKKMLASAENPAEMKAQLAAMVKPHISPYRAAGFAMIDDVIDPRDTRAVIVRALQFARHKVVERPARRREISPV